MLCILPNRQDTMAGVRMETLLCCVQAPETMMTDAAVVASQAVEGGFEVLPSFQISLKKSDATVTAAHESSSISIVSYRSDAFTRALEGIMAHVQPPFCTGNAHHVLLDVLSMWTTASLLTITQLLLSVLLPPSRLSGCAMSFCNSFHCTVAKHTALYIHASLASTIEVPSAFALHSALAALFSR